MDYNLLIKRLRAHKIKTDFGRFKPDICDKAATAIETMLAERDAAMKYISKVCSTCKHWDTGGRNAPIAGGVCTFDLREVWRWRGPQKEGADDGKA